MDSKLVHVSLVDGLATTVGGVAPRTDEQGYMVMLRRIGIIECYLSISSPFTSMWACSWFRTHLDEGVECGDSLILEIRADVKDEFVHPWR